ncbi:hypothetical protein A3A66_03085 [Microgenomates group bacterium RIFCSPLOWO2_01_FULL_46_13]|nr:MAG: hypothetical protein A2783_04920 [Microgenomates group bacterium RIFCSPHIGHO2_01_FULL_45_11]OGV94139.1 MAG: hypothetical protein A3A66_03085 [Microgenomates group bacterium RIFCSPLOWO2_01_FULL_46_13]
MLKLNAVMLGSAQPKKLADFYQKILTTKPAWSEGSWTGFEVGGLTLFIGSHSQVKGKSKQPARVIINFETKEVEAEFARIQKLGAKVIATPYHPMEDENMLIATFEDSDGNYFQLVSPM